ncbi:clr6 l associated factor 1 laf1 [Gigaspora margarita]|uniref:Clr6 l associated factor 1 laf1 n=3 Tax=Gigasporaceae TaxID=36753 RepID=A0A8H3X2P7_GIGMA|nr:clr6 l associated factor 1 laf1 [Gigaspora margarita]
MLSNCSSFEDSEPNYFPMTPSENGESPLINFKSIRKSRWRLSEVPPEIMQLITPPSSEASGSPTSFLPSTPGTPYSTTTQLIDDRCSPLPSPKIISSNLRKKLRKNPFPVRSPDRETTEDTMCLRINVYDIYKKNPKALLDRPQYRRNGYRKLQSVWETKIDKTQPPPPPLPFDELMSNLEDLDLSNKILDTIERPKITWRGPESNVEILPHAGVLHRVEAKACGILRLSPEQYINSKLIILTAAKEYKERSIPFRKVDAQRLVRIDVNKACKLWEFFSQAGWIHN